MRIGIFDPYLDDGGGGEKYMMTIAECLSKNHSVDVFWDNKEDFELVKKRFDLNLQGVKVVPNIFKENFINKLLKTAKYDSIFFLSDGSIPITLSRKLFIHIQRPFGNGEIDLKEKLKIRKVKKVFVNSKFTKNYIDKELGVKSLVVYPPVDLRPKEAKKENIILHVGRFRVRDATVKGFQDFKKQYLMVEEFKKIYKEKPDWKFILAVSVKDEDRKDFNKLVNSATGFPIDFVVNNNNKELWSIYSKAKIYWHASGFGENLDKNPELAEHFGISTVEAMGSGCVPAVINAGGQKEIVEDGVSGLLWNTLSELKAKTIDLIENKKRWGELSENASRRAMVFSEERFCREVYALINS